MTSNLVFTNGSGFRIKRPLITTSGFVSDVDPKIKANLDELNGLMGKRIFTVKQPQVQVHAQGAAAAAAVLQPVIKPELAQLLAKELTPKHVPEIDQNGQLVSWDSASLAFAFHEAKEDPAQLGLSDCIDMTSPLAALKYSFLSGLSANWFNLDDTTKTVLDGYPAISDYLIAMAYFTMHVEDVNGLMNFIMNNRLRAKAVADYAIVTAPRTIIYQDPPN